MHGKADSPQPNARRWLVAFPASNQKRGVEIFSMATSNAVSRNRLWRRAVRVKSVLGCPRSRMYSLYEEQL
ncbi:hypothetical protein F2P81_012263 [Scophthalmus maximus]|uniref:Uncharacterized protein n=1 Tax=Scophthalmus maximus TaxID=52904 RepID=A0A6A4SPI4_SCOMX|nr:hypothetical protein F2P81_012263 [Scophthalmus maximus]